MKKFYLGMDIGTDSVGMACTDEQYNLLRAKGKDLWAVRLFDEAKDASERRTKRTARRRLQRRKQRIEFLQEVFAPFMTDELFFLRLNNSGFYEEDKNEQLKTRFSLFADEEFTDRDFYLRYPTIFHLRKALAEGKTEGRTDIRLYYLALHHIVKYRGHFLFEGEDMSDVRDVKKLFERFNEISEELFPEKALILPLEKAEDFRTLALERKGLNDKKKEGAALLGVTCTEMKEFVALLLGATVKASALFGAEYEEEYKGEKLSFKKISDDDFEGKRTLFGENFALLEAARAIYNFFVFEKMLDGNNCISQAMVAIYEKHKADLELLKSFVKGTLPQKAYYRLFRSTKEAANYAAYVGYTKIKAKKVPVKKCKIEEFYKFVKKILMESVEVGAETGTLPGLIFAEMENGTFLPKILHADNGLFPHQVNGAELDAILENLCKDYPEFARKDEDGFTPAEKIKKIFLFKIPYYVGPLNNYHEEVGNSWVVRKKGRITPWNFDEMVNKAASNEKFIRRMTNKCSYLYGKDVLPKCSIVYQAFDVLNQLNKIKINEQPISVELKQKLFHDLFLTRKKVTKKAMRDYLVANGYVSQGEAKELSFSGFDGELQANMNSYITLKSKLGDFVDSHLEVCEEIILWHTLNTDKAVVESQILEKYGNEPIVKEKIKELKGLTSFKDFGRLSRELLCELSGGVEPTTGENYTILGLLYRTNANFNEILNDKRYTFLQAIEEENSGSKDEIGYEDLEELYVSPMVRRGIWQALQMTEEYVRAVGKAPDKIFLEVTREHEAEKQRTQSRKNQLLALYENCKDCKDISALLEQLNSKTDSELRQERLYLYFKQLGRCAYTGKSIDLEELSTDLYDVDHIMPRSITKDDGLENKVLVLRAKNAEKSDTYPLPSGFTDQQSFWKILKAKGLMGEKKYALLTRTAPLTEEDFRSFISRQLVVTNQTVKAVAELLKRKYGAQGTRIVYSKAANVSDFRQRFNLVKCRETNDLHHARDAYLNIVVGNVYDTKFTCAGDYFYRKDDAWREYSLKTLFFRDVEGAWKKVESICIVKRILAKPSMIVTRYAFVNKGGFYDETVYGKGDNGVSVPRKGVGPYTQTEKYGGFKSLSTAYFTIVASKDKKGNLIKTIEAVPVLVDYQCKGNVERLLEYFSSNGLIEPKILVAKLKVKSLISVNGFKGWIAGITGKQILLHKAQQWFTDEKTDLYVKNLVKLADWDRTGKLDENERLAEGFPMVTNRNGEVKLAVDRVQNLCLYDEILENLNKPIYRGVSGSASFAQKIAGKKEQFGSLSVLEQAKVLLQIIRFMKCNAECADLTLLNDVATCGKLLINKNITGVDFKIIHQSPCGLISRIDNV